MKYSPELLAAPKSARYKIAGLLGRGATSLVYKAFDLEKKFVVALKTVRFPEQDGIYQLKQEFRSFCDFYHPNIVELYDLYVDKKIRTHLSKVGKLNEINSILSALVESKYLGRAVVSI